MFRNIATAAAAVLCLTGAAPGPADPLDALFAGRTDPLTFDYGTLRERPDADAWLEAAEARAKRDVLRRQGVADDVAWENADFPGCVPERDLAILKGVSSARKVKTRAEWKAARIEAATAGERRESLRRVIFSGEKGPYDQLRGVERSIRLSREAKDPAVAELFQRAARDNFARWSIGFSARQFLVPELSDAALDLYDAPVLRETCLTDADNRAWLKATVARRGWFRISVDGSRADDAAWNMLQHADKDVAFQQEMLAVLEKLQGTPDGSPSNYAYLWDRVSVNTGKSQRYGSQGRCQGPGLWKPNAMEDPEGVDARRKAMGIDWPMADYIAKMNTFCR